MIRYKLWKMSRRARPDAKFVAHLASRFAPRVQPYASRLRFAAAVCAIVLLLGGGTAGYAYASDDVIPTHPLYPVREGVESLEENVAFTDEARAAVQRKHVERRLREIRTMRSRRLAIATTVITRLRDTMVRLESTSTAESVQAIDAWSALLLRRQRVLNRLEAERLDREADEKLGVVEKRVKQLQERAKQRRPGALRRK